MKNLTKLVLLSSFLSFPALSQEKPLKTQMNVDLNGDGVPERVAVDTSVVRRPALTISDGANGNVKKFNHFVGFKGLHYLRNGSSIVYLTGLTEEGNMKGFEIKYIDGEYLPTYKVFTKESNPEFFDK